MVTKNTLADDNGIPPVKTPPDSALLVFDTSFLSEAERKKLGKALEASFLEEKGDEGFFRFEETRLPILDRVMEKDDEQNLSRLELLLDFSQLTKEVKPAWKTKDEPKDKPKDKPRDKPRDKLAVLTEIEKNFYQNYRVVVATNAVATSLTGQTQEKASGGLALSQP
ncbi:MAG: hypothetical protein JWM96_1198 [Alphaproteobacteria bacterium]|nr:hypothetical protein [Alphaproteobacteria bacterium]